MGSVYLTQILLTWMNVDSQKVDSILVYFVGKVLFSAST